jgi:hypothetical protein
LDLFSAGTAPPQSTVGLHPIEKPSLVAQYKRIGTRANHGVMLSQTRVGQDADSEKTFRQPL